MKRKGALAAACLAAALLAGCGYQDGSYTAEFKHFDSLGYKDYLTVTVQNGAITAAEFDGKNAFGGKKSQDTDYARRMRPLAGTDPAALAEHYAGALLGLERPEDLEVDAVAGATVSAARFEALWQALQEPMESGSPAWVAVADIPEYAPQAADGE